MIYLLRRRGPAVPGELSTVVVRAPSEAHARVAAYEHDDDFAWTADSTSTCEPFDVEGNTAVIASLGAA